VSVLDKLMFWKKEPDLQGPEFGQPNTGLQRDLGMNSDVFGLNQDPYANQGFSQEPIGPPAAFGQQRLMPLYGDGTAQSTLHKDLEVVSAKLDALRASIDSMNQRIMNIESIAKQEQEKQRIRW